jgi:hypothetical protein
MTMRCCATLACLGVLAAAVGCSTAPPFEEIPDQTADAPFLFTVKVIPSTGAARDVADSNVLNSLCAVGENCATLYDPQHLADFIAADLARSGLFTRVLVTNDRRLAVTSTTSARTTAASGGAGAAEEQPACDLCLQVGLENLNLRSMDFGAGETAEALVSSGTPFGPGTNRFWPCTLSTVTWLFAGPACWWIADRDFGDPQSEDFAVPAIDIQPILEGTRGVGGRIQDPILLPRFQVSLKNIYLSFIERHNWRVAWLWNILLPPWMPPSIIAPSWTSVNESLATNSLWGLSEELRYELKENFRSRLVAEALAVVFRRYEDYYLLVKGGDEVGAVLVDGKPVQLDRVLRELEDRQLATARTALAAQLGTATQPVTLYTKGYRLQLGGIPSSVVPRIRLTVYNADRSRRLGSWTIAR